MKLIVSSIVVAAATAHAAPMEKLPPLVAVKSVDATSTYADKRDAYAAWHALAYDYREQMGAEPAVWSAWCEGKPDEGIGERVTITFAEPTPIDDLKLAAGVWRTDALFASNNQPTSFDVLVDGRPTRALATKGKAWSTLNIGGAKVSSIAIQIGAVKKGRMNDTCISAIDLERGGQRLVPIIGVSASAVAALPAALGAINDALGTRGKELAGLLEFPFSNRSAGMELEGGAKPMVAANLAAQTAACVAAAKTAANGALTNTACPAQIETANPDDTLYERAVKTTAPGHVEITWPSRNEVQVVWELHWTDRWRLASIGDVMQ